MAKTTLVAPCEPPTASVQRHYPSHVLGRIKRHGTSRIARRLHVGTGGCLPGAMGSLKAALTPTAALAATAGFGAVAVSDAPGSWTGSSGDPAIQGAEPGGATVTVTQHGHHHTVTLPEPASLPMVLLGLLAWSGLRRWWKLGSR